MWVPAFLFALESECSKRGPSEGARARVGYDCDKIEPPGQHPARP